MGRPKSRASMASAHAIGPVPVLLLALALALASALVADLARPTRPPKCTPMQETEVDDADAFKADRALRAFKKVQADFKRAYSCPFDTIELLAFKIVCKKSREVILIKLITSASEDYEDIVHIQVNLPMGQLKDAKLVGVANGFSSASRLPDRVNNLTRPCTPKHSLSNI